MVDDLRRRQRLLAARDHDGDDAAPVNGALLDAEDVAAMVGMGVDWVYAQARAGRIPHVKLGRCTRFRRESVEQWLAELEQSHTINAGK
jgi:excisionase family DNA binding protein